MSHVDIVFTGAIGADNKIEIDGIDLSRLVAGADLRIRAGEFGSLEVEFCLTSCNVTAEADVEFNGVPVTDHIGRQIYEQLKEVYVDKAETARTAPARNVIPARQDWKCTCNEGECVHRLLEEVCPHCGCRMVEVITTGFRFCLNDSLVCDYEESFQERGENDGR